MFVVRGARLRTPEHEPGGPSRGQLTVLRLHHDRQALPRLWLPRSETLSLTEALRVVSPRGLAPPVALLLQDVQHLQGVMAAPVPGLQHGIFVGVEDAVPAPFVGALRTGGAPEIAQHGPLGNLGGVPR